MGNDCAVTTVTVWLCVAVATNVGAGEISKGSWEDWLVTLSGTWAEGQQSVKGLETHAEILSGPSNLE